MSNLVAAANESPSAKWSKRLTPERIQELAECLIIGRTRKDTAELLGVSVRTVSRWAKLPIVLGEVERLRSRTRETRVDEVLLRLLESDDDRVVLAAIREIYRWKIQRPPEEPPRDDGPPPGIRRIVDVREKPFR